MLHVNNDQYYIFVYCLANKSFPDDSSSDEDETGELLAELARIKKERTNELQKKVTFLIFFSLSSAIQKTEKHAFYSHFQLHVIFASGS